MSGDLGLVGNGLQGIGNGIVVEDTCDCFKAFCVFLLHFHCTFRQYVSIYNNYHLINQSISFFVHSQSLIGFLFRGFLFCNFFVAHVSNANESSWK